MKYLIIFSFKNMFRKKERTLLTMLPMLFGTLILISVISILDGIALDSENNLRNYEMSDIRIIREDFYFDGKSNPKDFLFNKILPLEKFLQQSKQIEAFTNMLFFQANLSDGYSKIPVICAGIESNTYAKVFNTFKKSSLSFLNMTGTIAPGYDLLKFFNVDEDSVLIIEARTNYDTYDALDMKLSGYALTENPNIDRNYAYIPYIEAAQFLDAEGKINSIYIKLKNRSDGARFTAELNRISKEKEWGLKAETFDEMALDVIAITAAKNQTSAILVIVILLIGGIGIANTTLLSVYERMKEIGTMRAMGASKSIIMKLFLFEGAFIGLIGGLIGFLLGTLLMFVLSVKGIDLSFLIRDLNIGYPIKSIFRAQFNILISVRAAIFAFSISFICSMYPAYRATKENIVRILK